MNDRFERENGERPARGPAAFFAFLASLPDRLFSLLSRTLIGRFFLSYDTGCEALTDSRLLRYFRRSDLYRRTDDIRLRASDALTHGVLMRAVKWFGNLVRYTGARIYGVLFGTFGIYTVLVYIIKYFALASLNAESSVLWTGIGLILFALPTFFSRRPLTEMLQGNPLTNLFFYTFLGLRRSPAVRRHTATLPPILAFLLGSALGIAGFFLHPLYLVFGILALIAVFLLFASPELSLCTALFAAPFLLFTHRPAGLLVIPVAIGLVSYVSKMLLGKRLFYFGSADLAMTAVVVLCLATMPFTYGGGDAAWEAFELALLIGGGYFLSANLLISRAAIRRAIHAILLGASLVAALYLAAFFAEGLLPSGTDNRLLSEWIRRLSSVASDPDLLPPVLLLAFPLAAGRMLGRETGAGERFFSLLSFLLSMGALVLSFSRGSWIAAIAGLFLFLLAASPATLYFVLPVGVATPFLLGRFADPVAAESYRTDIWDGAWRLFLSHPLGGIGVGEGAFSALYPYYAVTGAENAAHAGNLFLHVLCESGVAGLLIVGFAILVVFSCLVTHRSREKSPEIRLTNVACTASLFSVLTAGLFNGVFFNSRVVFLFFALCGTAVALERVGRREEERNRPFRDDDGTSGSAEFLLSEDA